MKYACKSKRTEVQRHSDIEDIAIPGGFGEIRALYPLSLLFPPPVPVLAQ